ncbi:MAG TPA: ABC transporter ATP-binding protein [Actinomycetota bacterium]|nr:ABC transporter ATP-binding protein [Actinomycetota bacterium]
MVDVTDALVPSAGEAGTPKLSVRNLTVARRQASGELVTAAAGVTFDVGRGEFVCLLGPSGCGKTSILNVLAGLDRPASGQAFVDGRPITGPGPDRAVLFQDPALFPWLTVAGNVELALRLIDVPVAERRDRARSWLATVGLMRFADAHPHELSAGMRQRAALARALAADPEVLLGDEPFGQLDAQARELLQDEVQRAWVASEGRKTFVFVTHNVREAVVLADRVLVMSAGPGRLLEEFRIHAPRPRQLDDALVSRVVTEIHALLMQEVNADVARTTGR